MLGMNKLFTALAAASLLAACKDGNVGDAPEGGGSADGGGPPGAGGFFQGGAPSVEGCSIFPADNPWNQDVSGFDVHPNSDAFVDSVGRDSGMHADFGTVYEGAPIGIPFTVATAATPLVPVVFVESPEESDPGPYPIPPDAPIEGGGVEDGDRHVIVVDTDSCMLYELYRGFPLDGGASWEADSGAVFDLTSNETRPEGWTSADAAGLPIFPGLVKYSEIVEAGSLDHAVRITVSNSQAGYIAPATHYASADGNPNLPPMGLRLRMKADYDCSAYSSEVQTICAGFKRYGLIVADNGSDWYVSGAPDDRWNDEALADIANITGDAFEVVYTGDVVN
jgi:hypothetical protein